MSPCERVTLTNQHITAAERVCCLTYPFWCGGLVVFGGRTVVRSHLVEDLLSTSMGFLLEDRAGIEQMQQVHALSRGTPDWQHADRGSVNLASTSPAPDTRLHSRHVDIDQPASNLPFLHLRRSQHFHQLGGGSLLSRAQ